MQHNTKQNLTNLIACKFEYIEILDKKLRLHASATLSGDVILAYGKNGIPMSYK